MINDFCLVSLLKISKIKFHVIFVAAQLPCKYDTFKARLYNLNIVEAVAKQAT